MLERVQLEASVWVCEEEELGRSVTTVSKGNRGENLGFWE